MVSRARVLVGLGAVGGLVAATMAVAPVVARPAPPTVAPMSAEGARAATARLVSDADGALTLKRGFVGVPAGVSVDDPAVTPGTSVTDAARAHLTRYGAAFGADPASLVARDVTHTVAGTDSVRFTQRVGGVPVIGGEVVVGLRSDRELGSALATVSQVRKVATPVVSEDAASATARAVTARTTGAPATSLAVRSEGRWLLDPAALGAPARLGVHTVWRFDVTGGPALRRLVLVDVRTGAVVANLDAIEQIDRVICDNLNVSIASESDCASGFARTEGGAASGIADVNDAYDLSGAVSDFYAQIGGIDLTDALGIPVGGVKKLASTVRICFIGRTCPYPNAFWNGHGMYYGQDYASADDVVGHEMTHGIIDQHSELFYWGQSGAINESIADIMGEIVDHRHASPGDSAGDWQLGEDLPIGAIRDLQTPSVFGQPDRMTSGSYELDATYDDNGGVHTNSGVGNKTAYLISQGGSFNGQSITGIDAGDPMLTRTATLYLLVIQTLSSGSDYADLADVLDQSCQDLIGGPAGITAANCVAVHKAGLATELTVTPTQAPQPPDAQATCPSGAPRVLFDSESGDPATKFTAAGGWVRGESPDWGSNASSGVDSWFVPDSATIGTQPLTVAAPIALPSGQKSYLWFQHWRLLDFDAGGRYDGGIVAIDGADAGALPWVNGPTDVLSTQFGNPAGGSKSFGGDSLGYLASRVDLSSFAGQSVTPSFTLYTDASIGFIGWFVDDITVYTCDQLTNTALPTISGTPKVGKKLTAKPGSWSQGGVTFAYAWLRNGKAISGATKSTYKVSSADKGKRLSVRVTASKAGFPPTSATSAPTSKVK